MRKISECYERKEDVVVQHADVFCWEGEDIAVYGKNLCIHIEHWTKTKIYSSQVITKNKNFKRNIFRRKR